MKTKLSKTLLKAANQLVLSSPFFFSLSPLYRIRQPGDHLLMKTMWTYPDRLINGPRVKIVLSAVVLMVKNKFYEGPKRSEEVRHFFLGFNTTQACDPQFILRRGQTPAPGEQAKSMSRRRTELAGANVCAPHRKKLTLQWSLYCLCLQWLINRSADPGKGKVVFPFKM